MLSALLEVVISIEAGAGRRKQYYIAGSRGGAGGRHGVVERIDDFDVRSLLLVDGGAGRPRRRNQRLPCLAEEHQRSTPPAELARTSRPAADASRVLPAAARCGSVERAYSGERPLRRRGDAVVVIGDAVDAGDELQAMRHGVEAAHRRARWRRRRCRRRRPPPSPPARSARCADPAAVSPSTVRTGVSRAPSRQTTTSSRSSAAGARQVGVHR